jgi:hypothetical protein
MKPGARTDGLQSTVGSCAGEHRHLADYVEQISDDFQSTFIVVNKNTLQNMMGFPQDFCLLIDIIRKYLPNTIVSFTKTNVFPDKQYDIYLISTVDKETVS